MLECAADDLRANARAEIGVAHPAINVLVEAVVKPEVKQRQRIRHVITRDASPYFALLLENTTFLLKLDT